MENLTALKTKTAEIRSIRYAASVLSWDQQTHMPPGGAAARSTQLSTLSKVAHQMFTSDEIGKLIEAAEHEIAGKDFDDNDASLVRVLKRDYDRATRLPSEFVAEFSRTTSMAHHVWAKARAEKDFAQFLPTLEKIFDLCRQSAEYLTYPEVPYDALLDQYEPGMTTAQVATLFAGLREDLVPLAKAIFAKKDTNSNEPLRRHFPVEKQREFGLKVVQQFGYDMKRGRQDEAVHPFCIHFSRDDVRITTRFDPNFLAPALFGTMHEAGHASYEQGIPSEFSGTYLGGSVSLGIHESQSRLWENMVGRSRGFWEYFYPPLRETFPGVLDDVSVEQFYRAINYVAPSFIRVEADEVTYPLHIMLRFELEQDVLHGKLAVQDLPEAWNAKFEAYLGITPPDDAQGLLQDIHWSSGIMGYFPTYSIGTLLAAQLYEATLKDHPALPQEIAAGKFDTLLGWMNSHIHAHGRKFMPNELVKRATDESLQHRYFIDYLRRKYGEIYAL